MRKSKAIQELTQANRARTKLIRSGSILGGTLLALSLAACESEPQEEALAPQVAELTAQAPAVKSLVFVVDQKASDVTFTMDAEKEKITGRAPASASGTLHVDLQDLTKSTGLVKIDLNELSLYQQKRDSADEEFSESTKSETQNEHMRTWLQISEDGPAQEREANRFAEFKIASVGLSSQNSVNESQPEAELQISGSLRIHGRVTEHRFPVRAKFYFKDGKATSIDFKSLKPIEVSLEKHDVRPRSAFGVLADKTLDALGAKVAKVAKISLKFSAKVK